MNRDVVLMIIISEKKNSLHFPSKSLVSGALILEIIFIDDCQTHASLLQM